MQICIKHISIFAKNKLARKTANTGKKQPGFVPIHPLMIYISAVKHWPLVARLPFETHIKLVHDPDMLHGIVHLRPSLGRSWTCFAPIGAFKN